MRISDWSSDVCSSDLLVPFSLGAGGAWIANLTALAPYQPIFIAATLGFLGYGFYAVTGSHGGLAPGVRRPEERRVGTEWVSRSRSRWWTGYYKTHRQITRKTQTKAQRMDERRN